MDDGGLHYWRRLVHFAVDFLVFLLGLQIPYSVARALGADYPSGHMFNAGVVAFDRLEKVLSWYVTTHEMASCSNLRPFLTKARSEY